MALFGPRALAALPGEAVARRNEALGTHRALARAAVAEHRLHLDLADLRREAVHEVLGARATLELRRRGLGWQAVDLGRELVPQHALEPLAHPLARAEEVLGVVEQRLVDARRARDEADEGVVGLLLGVEHLARLPEVRVLLL